MSNYLKIGEFSRLMQTTVKTLRLYEQRGLLLPARTDGPWNQSDGANYLSLIQIPIEKA